MQHLRVFGEKGSIFPSSRENMSFLLAFLGGPGRKNPRIEPLPWAGNNYFSFWNFNMVKQGNILFSRKLGFALQVRKETLTASLPCSLSPSQATTAEVSISEVTQGQG